MKRISILMLISVSLLTACVVVPAGRGYHSNGVMIAPVLPPIVVLDAEPYYFYSGYHYHYTNDRWYYSKSKKGPWTDLPRSHYAKEVKHKGKHWKYDKGRDQYQRDMGRGDDQRNDNRGHDQRNDNRGQ
jgi:hypothetical protein